MATITGTIKLFGTGIKCAVVFEALQSLVDGGDVHLAERKTIVTGSDGTFSIVLPALNYQLCVRPSWRLTCRYFSVPDDNNTYTIGEVDTGTPGELTLALIGIAGWTSLKGLTRHLDNEVQHLLYLDAEGDGQGGEYRYDASSTATEAKPDVAKPDNVDLGDPGRWHRSQNPN